MAMQSYGSVPQRNTMNAASAPRKGLIEGQMITKKMTKKTRKKKGK
jgi:hypothetical protein